MEDKVEEGKGKGRLVAAAVGLRSGTTCGAHHVYFRDKRHYF